MDGKVASLFTCSNLAALEYFFPFSLCAIFSDLALVTLKVRWAKLYAVIPGTGATNNRSSFNDPVFPSSAAEVMHLLPSPVHLKLGCKCSMECLSTFFFFFFN